MVCASLQVLPAGRQNWANSINIPMGFAQEAALQAGPVEISDGGSGRWPVTMSWIPHTSQAETRGIPRFIYGWPQVREMHTASF